MPKPTVMDPVNKHKGNAFWEIESENKGGGISKDIKTEITFGIEWLQAMKKQHMDKRCAQIKTLSRKIKGILSAVP